MAKKSKTQRAKASARRAEKRDAVVADVLMDEVSQGQDAAEDAYDATSAGAAKEAAGKAASPANKVLVKQKDESSKAPAKKTAAPKPSRFQFFKDVRSELRRVTWPTRTDVIRWSGVVVGALLFFGVFVFVLDNIFPQLLILLDSVGA